MRLRMANEAHPLWQDLRRLKGFSFFPLSLAEGKSEKKASVFGPEDNKIDSPSVVWTIPMGQY